MVDSVCREEIWNLNSEKIKNIKRQDRKLPFAIEKFYNFSDILWGGGLVITLNSRTNESKTN